MAESSPHSVITITRRYRCVRGVGRDRSTRRARLMPEGDVRADALGRDRLSDEVRHSASRHAHRTGSIARGGTRDRRRVGSPGSRQSAGCQFGDEYGGGIAWSASDPKARSTASVRRRGSKDARRAAHEPVPKQRELSAVQRLKDDRVRARGDAPRSTGRSKALQRPDK